MTKNQQGLSSIMFAMMFATIVSLLVIAFTALVRNDLRQVTDQNLGYQAAYAAETAINQVAAELSTNSSAVQNQADCVNFDVQTSSAVNVTCVKWSDRGKEIYVSVLNQEPYASRINTGGSANDTIQIEYTADFKCKYPNAASLPNPLNPDPLCPQHYPVLKLSLLSDGTTNSKHIYIVPTGGAGSGSLAATANGGLVAASCNDDKCVINLTNTGNFRGNISIQAIGQDAQEIFVRALSSGSPLTLLEAQYTIEANSVAQDITKRVEARIPYGKQTWRPSSAMSTNQSCKDIIINGTTNGSSASGAAVCPAP